MFNAIAKLALSLVIVFTPTLAIDSSASAYCRRNGTTIGGMPGITCTGKTRCVRVGTRVIRGRKVIIMRCPRR
jgi:hypothetical protein